MQDSGILELRDSGIVGEGLNIERPTSNFHRLMMNGCMMQDPRFKIQDAGYKDTGIQEI